MNNKKIGMQFEHDVCELLSRAGWWVHFLSPDNRGAQPFDIIAVKNGKAMAIDCKTCARNIFTIDRLEENQKFAFQKWEECGNGSAFIYIGHNGRLYVLPYDKLIENNGRFDLRANRIYSCELKKC